jgi:hypothetical protein
MAEGLDHGMTKIMPGFDPALHAEVMAESIRGRKIEDYRVALESFGFGYVPANRLLPYVSGQLHSEGEWRSPSLRMALAESEVLAWFSSPEDFVKWLQRTLMQRRMKRSGLVMPR